VDIKSKLGGAQWRLHLERTIKVGDDDVPVVIRRPPEAALLGMIEAAKVAGEVDADSKPTSSLGAIRFMARTVALCLHAPDGIRPLFSGSADLQTVMDAPWLLEVQEDCLSAVGHGKVLTEAAKGFSEATPTSASQSASPSN
jgi:hypothetical protein